MRKEVQEQGGAPLTKIFSPKNERIGYFQMSLRDYKGWCMCKIINAATGSYRQAAHLFHNFRGTAAKNRAGNFSSQSAVCKRHTDFNFNTSGQYTPTCPSCSVTPNLTWPNKN